MAFRFQRRIRIAPGVRINLSKSGLGLSVGPRGYSTSIGPRGVYRNVGLPGTGLSYREKLGGGARNRSGAGRSETTQVQAEIDSDGKMHFLLPDGGVASQALAKRVREQNPEVIENLIKRAVEQFNTELNACLSVHLATPAPNYSPLSVLSDRPVEPVKPVPQCVGFWDKILLRKQRIESENTASLRKYEDARRTWHNAVQDFEALRAEISELNARVEAGDLDAQSKVLESRLHDVVWAKPTDIAFDFGDDATTLSLDVDLPTMEELPDREALAPTRGVNIRWKHRSDAQKRRDFCYLAHSVLFRVTGEVFTALPKLRQVTASGFTQRLDPATGRTSDAYLLSMRISREDWTQIDFHKLDVVDVQTALGSFELIRDMTRSNELRGIIPLS